jgi:hypothetical protein
MRSATLIGAVATLGALASCVEHEHPANSARASVVAAPLTESSNDPLTQLASRLGVARDRLVFFQQRADSLLVGEFLPTSRVGSDTHPLYRVWSCRNSCADAEVVLERAEWASRAGEDGSDLLAVEDGRLRLHQGAAVRTLLENVAPDFAVDGSGRYLAVVVRKPSLALDTDIVLVPERGGPIRTLVAFAGSSESRPIFTPDNRAIIFVSGHSGFASLWRLELEGKAEPLQLTDGHLNSVPPPPDRSAMRFEGADTLVYEVGKQQVRVNVGRPR